MPDTPTAEGGDNEIVQAGSCQYDKTTPAVDPVVTNGSVRSTVNGEHISRGLVTIMGFGLIVITAEVGKAH